MTALLTFTSERDRDNADWQISETSDYRTWPHADGLSLYVYDISEADAESFARIFGCKLDLDPDFGD